jgi:hypothetical protein
MPPPVVADHVPHRDPRGARGGHPLFLAMRWARDTAAMRRGSVTMMYSCRAVPRCHRADDKDRHCRRRRRRSDRPPPPSSSFSSFSSFSSRRNCGTCVDMPDPVNPASITTLFSCMARAIRSLCNDVDRQRRAAECSDLRAVSATSPPSPAPFLDNAAVVAIVIRRRRVVPPPPPFQPVPVRVLGGVQRIDSRCGKRTSVVAFFSAPAVVGSPVVAISSPVLLGIAAVGVREAPAPTPRGRGWSCHPTAKPGALSLSLTPTLPSPRSSFSLLPFAFAVFPMDGLGQFHGTFFGRTASSSLIVVIVHKDNAGVGR